MWNFTVYLKSFAEKKKCKAIPKFPHIKSEFTHLRGKDTAGQLSAIFTWDNFCDFLFSFLYIKSILKKIMLQKGLMRKCFSFNGMGSKTVWKSCLPASVSIPFSSWKCVSLHNERFNVKFSSHFHIYNHLKALSHHSLFKTQWDPKQNLCFVSNNNVCLRLKLLEYLTQVPILKFFLPNNALKNWSIPRLFLQSTIQFSHLPSNLLAF